MNKHWAITGLYFPAWVSVYPWFGSFLNLGASLYYVYLPITRVQKVVLQKQKQPGSFARGINNTTPLVTASRKTQAKITSTSGPFFIFYCQICYTRDFKRWTLSHRSYLMPKFLKFAFTYVVLELRWLDCTTLHAKNYAIQADWLFKNFKQSSVW